MDESGDVEAAGTATPGADLRPLPGVPPPENLLVRQGPAALVVGYVFSPIDPILDFIPGVGLLDEMVVVPIGVLIAAKMIPREVMKPPARSSR